MFASALRRVAAVACLVAMPAGALAEAVPGQPAPAFTLENADGKKVSLSDFAGKTVVLEWSNFNCPFVKKHYGSGNIPKLQETYTAKGVQWLSVFSSAPNKEGYYEGPQLKEKAKEAGSKASDLLRDPDGKVGKEYGAQTTPHMFVIGPDGKVVYAGAIDSLNGVDPAEIPKATNYVSAALDAVAAGKAPEVTQTKSYGCGVKY